MATEVSENEILQCLFKNIEESIPINFEWGKSLEGLIRRKVGKMVR